MIFKLRHASYLPEPQNVFKYAERLAELGVEVITELDYVYEDGTEYYKHSVDVTTLTDIEALCSICNSILIESDQITIGDDYY